MKSRTLTVQNNGLTLEWKHVENLYKAILLCAARSGGLKLAHKLTREHIFLTP